eukprot:COSAG03_NODE_15038_length_443_cov_0.473837_1_plen_113_part_10
MLRRTATEAVCGAAGVRGEWWVETEKKWFGRMLPHIGAATERTRGRKANRLTALEYTRAVDPAVLTELKRAKANSLTGLHKQQRTARFRRFVNSASMDRFLLVHACCSPICRL